MGSRRFPLRELLDHPELFGLMSEWLSRAELGALRVALGDPRVRQHYRTLLLPEDIDLLEEEASPAATEALLCLSASGAAWLPLAGSREERALARRLHSLRKPSTVRVEQLYFSFAFRKRAKHRHGTFWSWTGCRKLELTGCNCNNRPKRKQMTWPSFDGTRLCRCDVAPLSIVERACVVEFEVTCTYHVTR